MSNRRIVILPVDFSDAGLDWAAEQANGEYSADDVRFVHVLSVLPVMHPGVVWNSINDESRMQRVTRELQSRLSERSVPSPRVHTIVGDTARSICQLAADLGGSLIALPSRRRSTARRILLGSVAEEVVNQAECPVLVSRFDVEESINNEPLASTAP